MHSLFVIMTQILIALCCMCSSLVCAKMYSIENFVDMSSSMDTSSRSMMDSDADSLQDSASLEDRILDEILNEDYTQYPIFHPEPSCNRLGGMCVHRDHCDDVRSEFGCPEQAEAVCCGGPQKRDVACGNKIGICRGRCPPPLVYYPGNKDCPSAATCCVLTD